MHEFNGHCNTFAQTRIVQATSMGNGQGQLGANSGPTRKHGMTDRTGQLGRATGIFGRGQGHGQTLLDSGNCLHGFVSIG